MLYFFLFFFSLQIFLLPFSFSLKGHQGSITALKCNELYVISGSADDSVKVWDTTTGTCMLTLEQGVWLMEFELTWREWNFRNLFCPFIFFNYFSCFSSVIIVAFLTFRRQLPRCILTIAIYSLRIHKAYDGTLFLMIDNWDNTSTCERTLCCCAPSLRSSRFRVTALSCLKCQRMEAESLAWCERLTLLPLTLRS
jgi:hypothetical protein